MARKSKSPAPANPLVFPRFSGIATFNRLPWVPVEELLKDSGAFQAGVALLGVPWDGGTTFRTGARFGPRAVREASVLSRNYHPVLETAVYEHLQVVDAGDIATNPLNAEKTYKSIEETVGSLLSKKIKTLCVGGDHSIILPELRALKKAHGTVALVQFDAHTDTADQAWGERYHHGTPIRRAIEEGLLKGSEVFQIGIRGPLTSPDQEEYVRKQGIQILSMEDFHEAKIQKRFFEGLRRKLGKIPCFVSFDVDGVDPAFAPGTGTPVVGGLTSFEALNCLRKLSGLNVIGGDVVEIAPAYDHAQLTSLLGAQVVFEILSLMAVATSRTK